MLRSLTLKNFQAWPAVELELSPITVIIGETNAGKSSLLRGLACALFNSMEGQGMVRQGATVAEVTVLTDDDHTIVWSRGTSVNRYTLDGQLYDKPGRTVPLPVREALQIHELEFDGEVVRLQWAPQMDAPFLLADSGAKATRMMGVAGNAAVVAQAARLAQQESKSQADALRAATAHLTTLQTQLATFEDVDVAAPIAERLRQALDAADDLRRRRSQLEDLYTRQEAARPRKDTVLRQLATAKTLADRLTRWLTVHQKAQVLAAGEATVARGQALVHRSAKAEQLLDAWRQRHRLEELYALFTAATAVQQSLRTRQDQMDHALVHLDHCRQEHDAIVAAVTCPACGRVKDAA